MINLFDPDKKLSAPTWVLSDLDGTVVPDGSPEFSVEWQESVNACPFPISLSTGRSLSDAMPLIQKMPPQFHFVGGGSIVVKPDLSSEVLFALSDEQMSAVEKLAQSLGPEEYKYMRDGYWSKNRGSDGSPIPVMSLNFGLDELKALDAKIRVEELSLQLGAVVTTDTRKFYVHVSPLGSDKSFAVQYVRSLHEVRKPTTIVGLGDQKNDIPLLRECSYGLMVEGGAYELREFSIGSIPPPEKHGAVGAMKQLSEIK